MTIKTIPGTRQFQLTEGGIHGCFVVPLEPAALASLRKAFGFSKEEIARRLGITVDVWEKLEHGVSSMALTPD